jgi:uncharacterized protein (DUF2062 family)
MDRHYRALTRKLYRMLRHPRRRRASRFHAWIADLVHDRRIWRPMRHPLLNGLATGLFFGMLPPFFPQMLVSIAICAWRRWNIPVTVLACWTSNPATWVPQIYYQTMLGGWFLGLFGIAPAERIRWAQIERVFLPAEGSGLFRGLPGRMSTELGPYLLPYTAGFLLSGVVLAALALGIGHAVWGLFLHRVPVPHEVPHRHRRD